MLPKVFGIFYVCSKIEYSYGCILFGSSNARKSFDNDLSAGNTAVLFLNALKFYRKCKKTNSQSKRLHPSWVAKVHVLPVTGSSELPASKTKSFIISATNSSSKTLRSLPTPKLFTAGKEARHDNCQLISYNRRCHSYISK